MRYVRYSDEPVVLDRPVTTMTWAERVKLSLAISPRCNDRSGSQILKSSGTEIVTELQIVNPN